MQRSILENYRAIAGQLGLGLDEGAGAFTGSWNGWPLCIYPQNANYPYNLTIAIAAGRADGGLTREECVIQKPKNLKEIPLASLSPVVNTISALQAQEVLKVISEIGTPLLNKLLVFDGTTTEFKTLNYSKNTACAACSNLNSF